MHFAALSLKNTPGPILVVVAAFALSDVDLLQAWLWMCSVPSASIFSLHQQCTSKVYLRLTTCEQHTVLQRLCHLPAKQQFNSSLWEA